MFIKKLLICIDFFVNKMVIEIDFLSIFIIEESEVGRGWWLFDIMVKWVGGGCVLECGCLFEKNGIYKVILIIFINI